LREREEEKKRRREEEKKGGGEEDGEDWELSRVASLSDSDGCGDAHL
jgi:hypothetical protein